LSISWGKRQRFKFNSDGGLNIWTPPAAAGVFAITYKQDPVNRPKSHTVLYFGQGENLSQEAPQISTYMTEYWRGGLDELQVFVHPMAGSSSFDRARVVQQLVSEYAPLVADD